jgi:hypothetical protein
MILIKLFLNYKFNINYAKILHNMIHVNTFLPSSKLFNGMEGLEYLANLEIEDHKISKTQFPLTQTQLKTFIAFQKAQNLSKTYLEPICCLNHCSTGCIIVSSSAAAGGIISCFPCTTPIVAVTAGIFSSVISNTLSYFYTGTYPDQSSTRGDEKIEAEEELTNLYRDIKETLIDLYFSQDQQKAIDIGKKLNDEKLCMIENRLNEITDIPDQLQRELHELKELTNFIEENQISKITSPSLKNVLKSRQDIDLLLKTLAN